MPFVGQPSSTYIILSTSHHHHPTLLHNYLALYTRTNLY